MASDSVEETKRIHITLPERYIEALDILARSVSNRSEAIKNLLDKYIELDEETLRKNGTYQQLRSTLKDPLQKRILFIEEYFENNEVDNKYINYWKHAISNNDQEKIQKVYQWIMKEIEKVDKEFEDLL
jgi:metal-responsive CopG/Arc/MetJ family transcriptional regulator